jgi:hypothetical protein
MPKTFKQWIKTTNITDDPVGDFIADARQDPRLPNVKSKRALHWHLVRSGACQEAVKTIPEVWARFQNS